MFIYKITNIINKKVYIGKTIGSVEKRWQRHVRYSKNPKYCKTKIANTINKNGIQNFKIETIDTALTLCELNEKEIYWICKYNSFIDGYNLTNGGDGGAQEGEALEKIRQKAKNRITSLETRNKMSIDRTGHLNARSKKVTIVSEAGKEIASFYCLKYACDYLNINYSTGRAIAQKINKTNKTKVIINYV